MAKNTPVSFRNLNIYSVFTRNFSEEGTFNAVTKELDRIKDLGTDIVWFLPFYPIGEKNKKGAVGSPYAIRDYRAIDETHGTMEDFKTLVSEIHKRGMKAMIDIVLNHTSPDSVLVEEHPEWFFKKEDGSMGNQVGDWTDIVDLDYNNQDLWDYHIETLKQWAEIVDGARCDVAPLLPIEFWNQARREVEKVNPDFIWLAESIERHFLQDLRSQGIIAHSDAEVFEAFDLSYDYDIYLEFREYIDGKAPLSKYVHVLNLQDSSYPSNYVKMKFLENHDQDRAASFIKNPNDLLQWTAFNYLQKGATLIFNGQEVQAVKRPELFEKDPIQWDAEKDISDFMTHLAKLKKDYIPVGNDRYYLEADDAVDTVKLSFTNSNREILGVFNLKEKSGETNIKLKDGLYRNLISNEDVQIKNGVIDLIHTPALFEVN